MSFLYAQAETIENKIVGQKSLKFKENDSFCDLHYSVFQETESNNSKILSGNVPVGQNMRFLPFESYEK